ncbi:MAG TPA: protein phosphatase 2C domain-containing protein [Acidimicrobiales bacterium]|nr:protein phosphatase 2C domain-containing protein [Acidimicrobiales bacterium]
MNGAGAPPGFGRPSPAASAEALLAPSGDAAGAGWRAEAASTRWYSLRGASVAGVRHRLAGRGSDDSFAWAHDGDLLAVAVADGLGSVSGSADASRRACSAAVSAAVTGPVEDLMAAAEAGVEAANRAAEGAGATTLVVAVADRAGEVALARIGDSSAFGLKPDASWVELFAPPDPDRSGTATAALPAPDPVVETVTAGLWDGSVLVLATDGVADPWRDGPTTVAPSLVGTLLGRPSAVELLAVTDFSRQGCHDDRTLLCLWARPAEPEGE